MIGKVMMNSLMIGNLWQFNDTNLITNITIWLFNIAMENGPFIDGFPIKPPIRRDFLWLLYVK
jgi:hypothetical protein